MITEQTTVVNEISARVQRLETQGIKLIESKHNSPKKTISDPKQSNADTLDTLNKKIKSLESNINTYEGIVAVLNNQIEQDAKTIQTVKSETIQQLDHLKALERKISAQDRILTLKDFALSEQDIRIKTLNMTCYDGEFVWKITDFAQKRKDAISGKTISIYSPCFYTSRHGYKMCARMYLNGDGMGKGNHVSLFFVIMKGQFDALLRWPFRQKVTLMWLDQNHREHVIDAFRPDPTSSSFKRPEQNMPFNSPIVAISSLNGNGFAATLVFSLYVFPNSVTKDGMKCQAVDEDEKCETILRFEEHEVTTGIPGSEIMACMKFDISKLRIVLDQPI
uniref:TNF receptor-associated factor 2-like n=1 Tax=Saccoglossus kowalevskii TaxID=10224 RepID=A0ABM0MTY0_SACKO|nr:PREDICTED: TNF receptor-associated factor 2-like [Saccoglossus kowalevskii]